MGDDILKVFARLPVVAKRQIYVGRQMAVATGFRDFAH
jgi:hypothetical protein